MSLISKLDEISLGKIVLIREQLLKQQAQGSSVIRFESGDPNFSLAPHVSQAIEAATRAGKTHYVPNAGIPELRRAMFKKMVERNRIALRSDDDVFVTNGAMHALFVVFCCLLEPGDEVIVPDPMWTEVVENIRLAGGVPVRVALDRENEYAYTAEAIEKKITPRTKAIFINTPHNPTGAVLDRDQLTAIAELAKKHRLWVVSDEAYEHVIFPPDEHISIASLAPEWADRMISIFSCSKSYAMSGLRVGYIGCTSPAIKERLQKLLRCTINGVNSTAQWAALAAITGPTDHIDEMQAEYAIRRLIMFDALKQVDGLHPFLPRGSFFIWAECDASFYDRLGVESADEVSEFLAAQGIGSAPGSAFSESTSDALRFSFSCSTEMVREGSMALLEALTTGVRAAV